MMLIVSALCLMLVFWVRSFPFVGCAWHGLAVLCDRTMDAPIRIEPNLFGTLESYQTYYVGFAKIK